jgi:hypothetical protein
MALRAAADVLGGEAALAHACNAAETTLAVAGHHHDHRVCV